MNRKVYSNEIVICRQKWSANAMLKKKFDLPLDHFHSQVCKKNQVSNQLNRKKIEVWKCHLPTKMVGKWMVQLEKAIYRPKLSANGMFGLKCGFADNSGR